MFPFLKKIFSSVSGVLDDEPIREPLVCFDAKNRKVIAEEKDMLITVSKPDTGVEKKFHVSQSQQAKEFFNHLVNCTQN